MIKSSLRMKLFALISSLIIMFVLLSILFNQLFLESYYIRKKEALLTESYNRIADIYNINIQSITDELDKLEGANNLRIVLVDSDFKNIYNSRPLMEKGLGILRPETQNKAVQRQIAENMKLFKANPTIITHSDKNIDTSLLTLYGTINSGNNDFVYIIISTSIPAIKDSANIANDFFILTGFLTLLIGGIIIFLLTKKFIKPILQLNQIAKEMAVLNFSQKIKTSSKDELGQLGSSINSLSIQLEKSINELKQANSELQSDIRKKDEIDMMRKEFISNVSHELKTPISLIMGYSEGLKVNVNDNEKDYYCDVISDEALKMNKLVLKLLDLSQIEAGVAVMEKKRLNLTELVNFNLDRYSLVFREKEIDLSIQSDEDIYVFADYDRLEQVFSNYLSNAINHVNDNKIISVKIMKVMNNKVRVSVYNSGKHIPDACINRIWESFYKVDNARTRAYGGTGLGLYIVKAIITAMNGSYGVVNTLDGVEFWFELDSI